MVVPTEKLSDWLDGRSFDEWQEQFDRDGFLQFDNILSDDELSAIRQALTPYLDKNIAGRNEFEGHKSNRVYALLAKSPVFSTLATHPLVLAFAEADLGKECLLSACLAINLHPGETAQPWHFDDSHFLIPRPRPSMGLSAFWAISDLTQENGTTEFIPKSHLWPEDLIEGAVCAEDFAQNTDLPAKPTDRTDGVKAIMPAGSLMIAKGTLWHRGGANVSDASRLIITPQYCPGWTRPLENMSLAVPPEIARTLNPRAQELLGYSIHPPFMGYVDGRHPRRLL